MMQSIAAAPEQKTALHNQPFTRIKPSQPRKKRR
jgi:hypothetical protein